MKVRFVLVVLAAILGLSACGVKTAGETGTEIITAKKAVSLIAEETIILIDARTAVDYKKNHIENAVNISRADIVVNTPYPNLLCPPDQLEKVLGEIGISNSSSVVIYDSNKNMDSARLWWTLKIYGHDDVKVVSGGINALIQAGMSESITSPVPKSVTFKAAAVKSEMLADRKIIKDQINNPDSDMVIIDTRTFDEYCEGTIPGSILMDYSGNNFSDQTYRPVRQIQIRYLEEDVDFNDTIIMYCKTSIRGAQTYLALYNAGYRDLKLYDGAWVEWSARPAKPVCVPETKVFQIDSSDNS